MELRHLRAFVAVAEEGTFTSAARRLHISQPPLSRQVHQLERELGNTLFVCGYDGAALTSEGRMLLAPAVAVLKTFRDIEDFAGASHASPRALHIGVSCGLWEVLARIRALHVTRFPAFRVTARELCLGQRPRDKRSADLIITRQRPEGPVFQSAMLFEEQLVALINDRHPLASRQSVTLSDLASEPLLVSERHLEPGTWDATVELIRLAGIRPRIVEGQPPPCTLEAMAMIASGDGYYLSTASPFTQTRRASGVAVLPLGEPHAPLKVWVAWRADAPRDVNEFACSARSAFRE